MQKVYTMKNLDCANCAAKIEDKFNHHPGVQKAVIVFATRQLRLTADDPDALIPALEEIARTVEGEVSIVSRENSPSAASSSDKGCQCSGDTHCECGHNHHEHDHEHDHDHGEEEESGKPILIGAALFVLGLVLEALKFDLSGKLVQVLAYGILGLPILKAAGKNLIQGRMLDENFLMSIATLGAFAIGEFPEAVGVMLFYRVGEFFEHRAVARSRRQIMDAVDLRPETVTRLVGDSEQVIPAAEAKVGDILLVRPGDRIPLDGVVLTGESRLDTAPITGESVPVGVKPGAQVLSGCVNINGQLTIRAEKPLEASMVTRILNSVESAAASKPKIDRFITRFARIYTPVVVALAAAVAVIPSLFTGDWGYWVYTALSFLVMSCPCALVLSVPLAFFSGIGVGSKQGILFKGGASMEVLADIKAVAMDKTGTLTKGNFRVSDHTPDALLSLCAACEQRSTHPIALSIVAAAKERGLALDVPEALEELSGKGIRAQLGGKTVLCGNEKLLQAHGIAYDFVPQPGAAWVLCAVDGVFMGAIAVADELKNDASQAVAQLHAMGVQTAMLTGDNAFSAQAVADKCGIRRVYAGLLPGEKLERLQQLRSESGSVMFVGDGINDAPVLSGADVGAAMGSGADAAMEAADVVFMTAAMESVPQAIGIAKRTKQVAWQNVVFALAIKAIVMVLGLLGYASMWLAVFADSGVAMLCVVNAVRMLYARK